METNQNEWVQLGRWFKYNRDGQEYVCNIYRSFGYVQYFYYACISIEKCFRIFGINFRYKETIHEEIIFDLFDEYVGEDGFQLLGDEVWISKDIAKYVIEFQFESMESDIRYNQRKSDLSKVIKHSENLK